MGRQPPKRITEGLLGRLGLVPDEEGERNVATTLAHLGFGAGMGALFSAARAQLQLPGPPVVQGVVYGLAVYAVSYKGWIPALGILPPPEHDRPGRQAVTAFAHGVYGAVLGALAP
jgi:predicted cobalt transporter CbtA